MTKVLWHAFRRPPEWMEVRQVYAFIMDNSGSFFVQEDDGRFNLPGGKPEVFDGDEIATLRRECLEESQVATCGEEYLGFAEVDEEDGCSPYAQLRYLARVYRLDPVAPDPANGRTYSRRFIPLNEVPDTLGWGAIAHQQIDAVDALVSGRGIN